MEGVLDGIMYIGLLIIAHLKSVERGGFIYVLQMISLPLPGSIDIDRANLRTLS